MTDDFDPGPGWRSVDGEEYQRNRPGSLTWWDDKSSAVRHWIREEPVPPLPTEPQTVIQVRWRDRFVPRLDWTPNETGATYYLDSDLTWRPVIERLAPTYLGWRLVLDIAEFEVLAEPRSVTAKAVLERTWQWYISPTKGRPDREAFEDVAREFGVDL